MYLCKAGPLATRTAAVLQSQAQTLEGDFAGAAAFAAVVSAGLGLALGFDGAEGGGGIGLLSVTIHRDDAVVDQFDNDSVELLVTAGGGWSRFDADDAQDMEFITTVLLENIFIDIWTAGIGRITGPAVGNRRFDDLLTQESVFDIFTVNGFRRIVKQMEFLHFGSFLCGFWAGFAPGPVYGVRVEMGDYFRFASA